VPQLSQTQLSQIQLSQDWSWLASRGHVTVAH